MENLHVEAIQKSQWYIVCDLNKVIKELFKICKGLQTSRELILASVQEGQTSAEHFNKSLVTLNYLVTRLEDDVTKLVHFMRQLILILDQGIMIVHSNIIEEHAAVKDMLSKVMQPYQHSLSDSTKHLVKKERKPQKH